TASADRAFEAKIISAPHVRSASGDNLGPPVYNAFFSPTSERGPTHLISGAKTTLTFFIGLPTTESAARSPVNPRLLGMTGAVPLTVMLSCPVCTGRGLD